MDTRRRCCLPPQCDPLGICASLIRSYRCETPDGPLVQTETESPFQTFTYSAVSTETIIVRRWSERIGVIYEYNELNEYQRNGMLGTALSRSPFSAQDVIQTYGLSSYDHVTAVAGVYSPTFNLYRSVFHAWSESGTGPSVSASAGGGYGLGTVVTINGLVGSVTCENSTHTDVYQSFNCTNTTTTYREGAVIGGTHNLIHRMKTGYETYRTCTDSQGVYHEEDISTVERIGQTSLVPQIRSPSMLDGTDGGVDCSGTATSTGIDLSTGTPSDHAIESYMASDPLRRCRGCGQ